MDERVRDGLAVRARGLGKRFGPVVALDGVDLDIAPGQIHGLVGPNGAGKTTLLGLLLHLAAQASLRGDDEGPGAIDDVLHQVGLTDVAGDRVRGFSLGMRQRLGLAAALLTRPRLLVLDEPANGLDPAGTRHVHRVLSSLAAGGATIVLSSHRMDDLAALCGEVTILNTGRVVFSGPVRKLATEVGELDYRLRTSDTARARTVAEAAAGVRVLPDDPMLQRQDSEAVLVRGAIAALDEVVAALVAAGVAVREFAPVVSPLEAAFLALTDDDPVERGADR